MGITDIQFPLSLFSENRDKAILANREFMDEEEQIAMTATEYGYTPQKSKAKEKPKSISS